MKFFIILLAALLASVNANSGSLYLYLDQKSYHFPAHDKDYYIDNHKLIGFEYNSWLIVQYSNSEGRPSTILGRNYEAGCISVVCYGVKYGLVSGYGGAANIIGDFSPFLMFNSSVNFGPVAIDFNLIPDIVISAGWKFNF